jgi:hypothetical protein
MPTLALAATAALGAGLAPSLAATPPTAATAPTTPGQALYCGIVWGSLARSAESTATGSVANVRAGRHTCFDRLVVDVRGRAPGYDVRYVPSVYADGSGLLVPLRGGARLRIVAKVPAYTPAGAPSFAPASPRELVDVSGYSTFRQLAWAGSFEGQTTVGLGVRARLPFRVFTLYDRATNTSRLVVDVAHRW